MSGQEEGKRRWRWSEGVVSWLKMGPQQPPTSPPRVPEEQAPSPEGEAATREEGGEEEKLLRVRFQFPPTSEGGEGAEGEGQTPPPPVAAAAEATLPHAMEKETVGRSGAEGARPPPPPPPPQPPGCAIREEGSAGVVDRAPTGDGVAEEETIVVAEEEASLPETSLPEASLSLPSFDVDDGDEAEESFRGDSLKRRLEELLKPLDFAGDVLLGGESDEEEEVGGGGGGERVEEEEELSPRPEDGEVGGQEAAAEVPSTVEGAVPGQDADVRSVVSDAEGIRVDGIVVSMDPSGPQGEDYCDDDGASSKMASSAYPDTDDEFYGCYSFSSPPLSDYEAVDVDGPCKSDQRAGRLPARRLMRRAWCAVRGFGAKAKRLGRQLQEEASGAVSQAKAAAQSVREQVKESAGDASGVEPGPSGSQGEEGCGVGVIPLVGASASEGGPSEGLRVLVLGDDVTRRLRNARARRPRAHLDRPRSVVHFRRSRYFHQGQSSFEELRRFVKQGSDFCKDLSAILQERSEAEAQYAKSLSKLSGKLVKASKEALGSVSHAWQLVGAEMEAESEIHRALSVALSEEVSKPLRSLLESHHRTRKQVEAVVEKAGKSLSEWRTAEAKTKKHSFLCARENERLQDASLLVEARLGRASRASSTSSTGAEKGPLGSTNANGSINHHNNQHHLSEKELAKLESKRRKAEEAVRKADVEYYTFSIRAERARLEWETAVNKGSQCFQSLEEERLQNLKELAARYLSHIQEVGPKRVQSSDRLTEPILRGCDVSRDLGAVSAIRGSGQPIPEQLLPDFYSEHITLAMNRERRRQNLVKLLQLIRSDVERERRGKQGVENLARALQQTPTFGSQDSQQNVTEKLHHMCSMLTYLEAARFKVQGALAELDGRQRAPHPLAPHITVTRDRQGLQQSVLKVPPWVWQQGVTPLEQLSAGDSPDWTDRGKADGNSVQPDSDFDEFSSQGSDKEYQSSIAYPVISENGDATAPSVGRCRALYDYAPNLYDELKLRPGDVINIHDKQADGWWLGELNGTIGIFPATYVEEIK